MTPAADTFGGYGRPGSLALRAARAADRVVTGAIVCALALVVALSGYALWDSYQVIAAGTSTLKGPAEEGGLTFAELLALNEDVVGWIALDGTAIDFPVVQGEDDYEYLTKSVEGGYSAAGAIYLMAACAADFSDPYSVVMGHHMANSAMFGDLDLYLEEGFLEENHTGWLYLPDRSLELEVVAVLQADAYDATVYGVPGTEASVAALAALIEEEALFSYGEAIEADDQLIALSTCASGAGTDMRTVVVCRVVAETEAVDASTVS